MGSVNGWVALVTIATVFFSLSLKVAREGRGGVSLMYRLINQIGFLSLMDRQPFSSNRFFFIFSFFLRCCLVIVSSPCTVRSVRIEAVTQ